MADTLRYENCLSSIEWDAAWKSVSDVGDRLLYFVVTFNDLYKDWFPLKTKYLTLKRLSKLWWTSGILMSIKMKSVYFKFFKSGLIDDNFNRV